MQHRVGIAVLLGLMAGMSGCATGEPSDEGTGVDAAVTKDTGTKSDANGNCPTGRTGPNCAACANGFHKCGADCRPDQANTPNVGCTQGCGDACKPPAHATAKCTTQGACDFTCDPTFEPGGGGDAGAGSCACPSGQVECSGKCQQCCTASDCPANVQCNGGTCSGCVPDYGDCNSNMSDGCETKLDSKSNCGACGNKCCGSVCGCGFLGLGGESCNVSGQTHKCGC